MRLGRRARPSCLHIKTSGHHYAGRDPPGSRNGFAHSGRDHAATAGGGPAHHGRRPRHYAGAVLRAG